MNGTSMNCAAFERRLEPYQAGTLPEAERRETDRHLYHCAACRALFEVLQVSEQVTGQLDLSEAVLSRTIGSACGKCRSLLGDLLDGALERVESELVMSHLGSCASCGSLFHVMSEMAEVLPRMREVEPDSSLVPQVLTSIRALKQDRFGFSRILDFFGSLSERPRFSWEAAYLGTLLIFALFGTPFSPVHEAGSRLLASLQEREGLIAQADSSIQRLRDDAEIAIGASDRARQTASLMLAKSARTAERIVGQARSYIRYSEEQMQSLAGAAHTKMVDVYRQAKGSEAQAKR